METDHFLPIPSKFPLVVKNGVEKWRIVKFSEKDWCELFRGQTLKFRKGDNIVRKDPYWEQLCTHEYLTLKQFFDISALERQQWLYYDYKYIKDVSLSKEFCHQLRWSDLGFKDLSGEDSTLWIGNKGAHTPCHMDTYGCNLVAQLYGRKMWILIPPEESDSLNPVRVPYEESSIYSAHNFYTPSDQLQKIKNVYSIILNPGDVLFVPRHWWHYVENLEAAISVNIWIPLEADDESRLEEALVRNYICNVCHDLNEHEAKSLLNPNEQDLLSKPFHHETLSLVIENCRTYRKKKCEGLCQPCGPNWAESLNALPVPKLEDIKLFLQSRWQIPEQHCQPDKICEPLSDKAEMARMLINSYCNPRNVSFVKEILLQQVNESKLTNAS